MHGANMKMHKFFSKPCKLTGEIVSLTAIYGGGDFF